jgi:Mn2+/Fe2+ NRAMP family transporter
MVAPNKINPLAVIGPGLLVAATGVGAGDLATASFAGNLLGPAILWAVVVGAFLKFVVTEGLARWQLATGDTLLEGAVHRLGPIVGWLFLPYLLLWSFFVGSALMGACGVTLHAMIPLFDEASQGKIFFGVISSLVGLALVLAGGYRLFDQIMRVCIALMFATALATAALVWPGWNEVISGLLLPTIPDLHGEGLGWTVALIGGVGGTLTVLCYGYWIREEGRSGAEHLTVCRIDLAAGYVMTAIFGIAMVIIGSAVELEGRGAGLLVSISDHLTDQLGPLGKWLFLIGAAGAVFSSLLGVWQAVPYLFADTWALLTGPRAVRTGTLPPALYDTASLPYRAYLFALATLPMVGLFWSFQDVQKIYAIIGAMFIPLLALILLILNGRAQWVGEGLKNSWSTTLVLLAAVGLFVWIAVRTASG